VRFLALTFVALFVGVSPVLSSLVTTNIYVVSPDQPVNEDVYVTSTKGIVDGTINGDLTIFTGDLYIGGTVTGSVHVFSSGTVTVAEGATVGGSLRGAAVNVRIYGDVINDVFVTTASTVVEEPGVIGRDLMAFGGVVRVEGTVGRDVRGRSVRTVIDGEVGGDIDIATQKMEVGNTAVIGGDVQYRSPVGGSIDSGAQISGSVKRLPTQSNFIYGVILALANLVGFLGFVVVGLVTLFVARGSGSRAAGAVITNPFKTLLWGLAAVVVTPFATAVIAATLVGLPLALLMAMVMIAGLIIGPIPAVTALGNRLLFKRGGLLGAFVVGAVLWRLGIWLVPVVGGVLFVLALIWGVGAWIVGILAARNSDPVPMALMPASMIPESGVPDDWQAPLAPNAAVAAVAVTETDEVQADADDGSDGESDGGEVESWDATEGEVDGGVPEETPASDDRAPSADVAPAAEKPPPLQPLGPPAADQDDEAARRRAEFEALLDSALSDADDDSADGSSDDEWGLPTS
jgi:cytoskeletal protein CcmA (bactofilin family)